MRLASKFGVRVNPAWNPMRLLGANDSVWKLFRVETESYPMQTGTELLWAIYL